MRKLFVLVIMYFAFCMHSQSKTWIVDQNGLGDYTSISAAINVTKPGDIVKVNPGIYNEKVVINKDILVEGSGAENTIISNQNKDYSVEISVGKIRWFAITSQGTGAFSNGGTITNCIFMNCSSAGIECHNGAKVLNCLSIRNSGGYAIKRTHNPIIINCIAFQNSGPGFYTIDNSGGSSYNVEYNLAFSNNGKNYDNTTVGPNTNSKSQAFKHTGSLEVDPQFQPNSYQISAGSPCIDSGNPAYQDPDGTRADMGYYGGPDASTFPVLRQSLIKLNEDGTIQLEAIGISPY